MVCPDEETPNNDFYKNRADRTPEPPVVRTSIWGRWSSILDKIIQPNKEEDSNGNDE